MIPALCNPQIHLDPGGHTPSAMAAGPSPARCELAVIPRCRGCGQPLPPSLYGHHYCSYCYAAQRLHWPSRAGPNWPGPTRHPAREIGPTCVECGEDAGESAEICPHCLGPLCDVCDGMSPHRAECFRALGD